MSTPPSPLRTLVDFIPASWFPAKSPVTMMFEEDIIPHSRVDLAESKPRGAAMPEAKIYRQYAADCRRLAKTMNQQDGAILLKMAEAWDMRADDAEKAEIKKSGGKRPH